MGSRARRVAQEGHPLKGSWLGEWTGNQVHGDNILLILDWDGKAVTGMINPGTDNIPLTKASLDPNGWVVKIEADAKDKSGAAVHYVIEGHIENLELPNRADHGHVVEPERPRQVRGRAAMNPRTAARMGALLAAALVARGAAAHHALAAKFDDTKPLSLAGIVTSVDWRNPHVHVFFNVTAPDKSVENWAVELESTVLLKKSGWSRTALAPGDAIKVDGIAARDGTRQLWGSNVIAGRHESARAERDRHGAASRRRWRGPRRAGPMARRSSVRRPAPAAIGRYPTSSVLMQAGAKVSMNADGVLAKLTDAPQVAPFQPWALGLYQHRQQRHLADDPAFLNCKPPGAVRQFQQPYGVQFVEDRKSKRMFVLVGSGNRNYRIIYLDGRARQGQVQGDDDNPLYYGRAVGHWEGDTLVVETSGFNEDFWFSNGGLPHTDKLSLVERFSRPNLDTLRYEVTINDPGAYTRSRGRAAGS